MTSRMFTAERLHAIIFDMVIQRKQTV